MAAPQGWNARPRSMPCHEISSREPTGRSFVAGPDTKRAVDCAIGVDDTLHSGLGGSWSDTCTSSSGTGVGRTSSWLARQAVAAARGPTVTRIASESVAAGVRALAWETSAAKGFLGIRFPRPESLAGGGPSTWRGKTTPASRTRPGLRTRGHRKATAHAPETFWTAVQKVCPKLQDDGDAAV